MRMRATVCVPHEWGLIVPGCKFEVEKVDENNFWVDVRVETRLLRFRLAEPLTSSDEAVPDEELPAMNLDIAWRMATLALARAEHTEHKIKDALTESKKSMAQDKKALHQATKAVTLARAARAKAKNARLKVQKRPAAPELTDMKRPRL
jgi:hypothetical protein